MPIRVTDGKLRTLELLDEVAGSAVSIVPSRGGIVTRFDVRGRRLLFLDEATLLDPSANVRGGVPLLFPSPGKLENDAWSRAGRAGSMKQHGFARALAWSVASTHDDDDEASVTLGLASSDATLAAFPWRFALELRYTLRAAALHIDLRVVNEDTTAMPFGFGVHPYFAVGAADKSRLTIPTKATRAFDNVTKREVAFEGFDFTRPEVDLHLLDHAASEGALVFADGSRISIKGSPEFGHWVVWSLSNRDFVCLEPWTSPGNALNSGRGVIELAAGDEKRLSLVIALA